MPRPAHSVASAASSPNDNFEKFEIRNAGVASMTVAAPAAQAQGVLVDSDHQRSRLDIENLDGAITVYVDTVGADDTTKMLGIAPGDTKIVTVSEAAEDRAARATWYVKAGAAGTPSVKVTSYIT